MNFTSPTGSERSSSEPPMSDPDDLSDGAASLVDDDNYLPNGDTSSCDLILVFKSCQYPVHLTVLEANSDFIKNWARFPGSAPSSQELITTSPQDPITPSPKIPITQEPGHDAIPSTNYDEGDLCEQIEGLNLNLPQVEIDVGLIFVPFEDQHHAINCDDFRNYLRMAYSVWRPNDDALSAMKIVPIADYMQSQRIREVCDLEMARISISWSIRLCHTAFDFARRWSLPHLAGAICAWINANVPTDTVLARLMLSTADHLLAMLPELDMDPVIQVQALVRYVCRKPLKGELIGRLPVEGDMVDVLCRGYRGLYGRWTRSRATLEVMRQTHAMSFQNMEARSCVMQCLLEILQKQLEAGPLIYWGECHCYNRAF